VIGRHEWKRQCDEWRAGMKATKQAYDTHPNWKEPKTMLDITKPVQTRIGKPARIICTDRKSKNGYPLVALVDEGNGIERVYTYKTDGTFLDGVPNRPDDLVNKVELGPVHKHARAIIAHALGIPIQYRPQSRIEWTDCRTPGWHDHVEYRIKPGFEHHVNVVHQP
jgi:hypothetical protein